MGSILQKIAYVSRGDSTESEVARFLLHYEGDFQSLHIKEIQAACHVSIATATRLAKTLGYEGFSELKFDLAQEQEYIKYEHKQFNIPTYVEQVIDSLKQTSTNISMSHITSLVNAIKQSDKIVIFAIGGTQLVAKDFQYKLARLGYFCSAFSDTHMQFIDSTHVTSKTLAIGITYSGSTVEVGVNMKKAKENGAITACITGNSEALDFETDYLIEISSGDFLSRNVSLSSRIMILVVLDIIYQDLLATDIKEADRTLEKTKYKGDFYR